MIGMLTGSVALRIDPYIILDVHGVGYKVLVSRDVLARAATGVSLQLFTYTHVREDALELYGFASHNDLLLFEQLIAVSGVGCKSAIGIFAVGNRSQIISAIMTGDVGFFQSVPRLGKKNSQKIIIELKNKVGSTSDLDLSEPSRMLESDDVMVALQGFGFTEREAARAIQAVGEEGKDTAEKLRLALKFLGK